MGGIARNLAKQTVWMLAMMIGLVEKVGLARSVARSVARSLARKVPNRGRESFVETIMITMEKGLRGGKVQQEQLRFNKFLIQAIKEMKLVLFYCKLSEL